MPKAITVIFSLAPPPPLDLVCGGGGGGRLGAQREDPTFFPLKTRERKMSPCPKKRKGKGGICISSGVFLPFSSSFFSNGDLAALYCSIFILLRSSSDKFRTKRCINV